MKKTFIEIGTDLSHAIENLQGAVYSYDSGFIQSTLSIAASIRSLFHQTNQSECLIKQVCDYENKNMRRLEMISTKRITDPAAKIVLFDGSMCQMRFDFNSLDFLPNLDASPQRHVTFEEWWNENVIRDIRSGYSNPVWFSRQQLILAHANKEGGTHFDPNKSRIHDLGSSAAAGWKYYNSSKGEVNESYANQKSATIRQIAYEVLVSLHNHYSKFFLNLIF